MSVPNTNSRIQYTLASATQTVAVPFFFLEEEHLKVIRLRAGVYTTLILATHYTTTGENGEAGGAVIFNGAGTAIADVITIIRSIPINQLVDLVYNGRFPGETIERALDRLTMVCQALSETLGRTIRFEAGEVLDGEMELGGRLGKLAAFNLTTGALEFVDGTDLIAETAANAALAQDAADAADISKDAAAASAVEAAASATAAIVAFTKPESFGAIGDGIVDDTIAVNSAISESRSIYLTTGKKYLVTSISNVLGSQFYGSGKIVSAVTGGQKQLNTYADLSKYVTGREFLSYAHNLFISGTPKSTACKIVFTGDSTTNGDAATTPYRIWELIPALAVDLGFSGVTGVNRGQSGASAADWIATHLAGDLATTPNILVIRWGANDPYYGRTAAQTITSIRSGLTTIRASRTVANLSIVLCTPNSMSDVPNSRDAKYFEDLSLGLRQAARDFSCCFVDVYAYLKESVGAANIWMDDPYADGRAIHPLNVMNTWISTILGNAIFPAGLAAKVKTNANWNIIGATLVKAATDAPQTYPYGQSHLRAMTGFPYDGMVLTNRFADDYSIQVNYPYLSSTTRYATRISNGVNWNDWAYVDQSTSNITPNTGLTQPANEKMRVVSNGSSVVGDGYLNVTVPATFASGAVIGTVPIGWRPAAGNAVWGVPVAAYSSGTTFEYIKASIDDVGVITLRQPITITATRIYLTSASWIKVA
jgi:hypothetical protein